MLDEILGPTVYLTRPVMKVLIGWRLLSPGGSLELAPVLLSADVEFPVDCLQSAPAPASAPSPGSPQCSWPAAAAVECRMH